MKMSNKLFIYLGAVVLTALFNTGTGQAIEFKTGIDEQAQLPFWEVSAPGMSLRLVQRLPIQTRAFFLARGFNKAQVERVAQSCIFQTVFTNTSNLGDTPSPLSYDLNNWQVMVNGESHSMKLREDWDRQWRAEKVKKAQRLAFEWALYPTQQSYQPGDFNWGMSSFNLVPGTRFDLKISWRQFGQSHSTLIKDMQCAEDVNPQTTETM
jgi:hypothetical protein